MPEQGCWCRRGNAAARCSSHAYDATVLLILLIAPSAEDLVHVFLMDSALRHPVIPLNHQPGDVIELSDIGFHSRQSQTASCTSTVLFVVDDRRQLARRWFENVS